MPNAVLAQFAGFGDFEPVLIAPDQNQRVQTLLQALSAHPDAQKLFAQGNDFVSDMAHDDFWPAAGSWESSYKPYVVKQGLLLVPVKGMLLHNFPYAVGSYATGYYFIQKSIERGMLDPEVKGIALVCDSPGGHVAGCFELVDRIYAARGTKPIAAFAHESAYSAAYAVASAASRITMSRTGGVGSIGVVTMHMDYSGYLEQAGLKITFIFAGKHKVDGNPYQALSDDAKERIQTRIDTMYGVFVESVARNRKMDAKKIRATEALTYGSDEAIGQGLADKVGPLDDALAEFATCLLGDDGDEQMTTQTAPAATVSQADHDAAVAAATKTAAAAAKARITAILGHADAKDRGTLANHLAMNTDMDAEAAVAVLAASPKETAAAAVTPKSPLDAAMAAAGEGTPGAGGGNGGVELTAEQKADARAEEILAARFGPKAK